MITRRRFTVAAAARHYFGQRTLLGCDARAAIYLALALALAHAGARTAAHV